MSIFFTADTHFGHENIIKHCERPFDSMEEMNATLKSSWNLRVKNADEVYILGDFWFKGGSADNALGLLRTLKGKKHLVVGNHDKKYLGDNDYRSCFLEVADILNLTLDGERIIMCHYPIVEWEGCKSTK